MLCSFLLLMMIVGLEVRGVTIDEMGQNDYESAMRELHSANPPTKEMTETKAAALATKYGTKLLPLLSKEILSRNGQARSLAKLTLLRIEDKQRLMGIYCDAAQRADGLVLKDIISGISDMPNANVLEAAKRLTQESVPEETRISILPLLGIFGDKDTLSYLEALEKGSSSETFKKSLAVTKEQLKYRLSLNNAARQEWDAQAIAYWRIPRDVEMMRGVTVEYFRKARMLKERGYHFSLLFLRYQLEKGDPLAAAIIGVQKDKAGRKDLEQALKQKGVMGDVCHSAMSSLDTSIRPNNGKER